MSEIEVMLATRSHEVVEDRIQRNFGVIVYYLVEQHERFIIKKQDCD